MHCLLHAQHEDITTLLVPHYVHTTCHNLQRHTEHMIHTYTARWHTYLVQQYRSTRRKSKYDHEGNETKKSMLCGAIYTIDAYVPTFRLHRIQQNSESKRGESRLPSLCTAVHSMNCVTPSFYINYQSYNSSPRLSRDPDHRFSSLIRPAVLLLLFLRCLPVVILMHYLNQKWPGMLLYFYVRIYDCTSTCVKRDYQPTRIPAEAPCYERIKSYL